MAQFIISLAALEENGRILQQIGAQSGAKIALALKAFSCWPSFDSLRPYLDGCCASGLWESQLSQQYFGKETLTYAPAYSKSDLSKLLAITTHLDFNSLSQWERFRNECLNHPRAQAGEIHFGLRINPQHSTGSTPLYDPCAPGSRLGITAQELASANLEGLSTLHFHTLCEQPFADLESTMQTVLAHFGDLLSSSQFTTLNLGGGHWITQPDYDRAALVDFLSIMKERYQLQVWLEPGEAVAIRSGVLRAEVLDTFVSDGIHHAILDTSPTCHTPDVLEMPYRPEVYLREQEPTLDGRQPCVCLPGEHYSPTGENEDFCYRLGGLSCLAGDIFGDYHFRRPLEVGDLLVFDDMAHYSFVKSTFFNGVPHPDLVLLHSDGQREVIREFGYSDFVARLGSLEQESAQS